MYVKVVSRIPPILLLAEAHIKTEEWLKETALTYTILRHNLYTEVIPMFVGYVLETGTIYLPAEDGKTAFAAREDMAIAAAKVLTSTNHENKIYEITGNKAYTYADIAAMISEITGKDSAIMQEEIFGPIFPILNYEEMDEVVDYINSNSKPLGLYMFSDNQENVDKVINGTSSGGVTINEAMVHAFDPALPFGGVNGSGMGTYHGKQGFIELSHQKSILYDTDKEANMQLAPPFDGKLEKIKESGASIFG